MRLTIFSTKLQIKLMACIVAPFFTIAGISAYLIYNFHKKQLIETFMNSAANLSGLVQIGLEQAMLLNRPFLLDGMVDDLSRKEGVKEIFILDKKGRIKVSSQRNSVGGVLEKSEPTCQVCHRLTPQNRARAVVVRNDAGLEILRNSSPIFNRPECHNCHSPGERVLGVLIMDFSLEAINAKLAASFKKISFWAFVLSVVTLMILSFFMKKSFIDRIKQLVGATRRIGSGDLDFKIDVGGNDEVANLSRDFDSMRKALKKNMDELEKHKDHLENIINSIDDGLIVVDRELRVMSANEAYLAMMGISREQAIGSYCCSHPGRQLMSCGEDNEICPVERTFKTGKMAKAIHRFRDRKGVERELEIFSSPLKGAGSSVVGAIEVIRDITERKQLEAKLIHSDRLASLGLLASGLAHEINTPLGSILACIDGLQRRLSKNIAAGPQRPDGFAEYLELMRSETMRCKGVTEKLLILSAKSAVKNDYVDLNKSVGETISLLRHKAEEKGVKLDLVLDPAMRPICGNEAQMRQLALNLAMNAIEATGSGGRIVVKVKYKNGKAKIAFSDDGCGIKRHNLRKIFQPFYTEKETGKGTGLGLFICDSIVKNHGGKIAVRSRPGKGAIFVATIPANGARVDLEKI